MRLGSNSFVAFTTMPSSSVPRLHVCAGDRAAVGRCVPRLGSSLRQGEIRRAVVGGVDSYLFPQWLEPSRPRLPHFRQTCLRRVSPGGGCRLLRARVRARCNGPSGSPASPVARRGSEHRELPTERMPAKPQRRSRRLLAPSARRCGAQPVFVCDLNGESWRTKEWAYAAARLGKRLSTPLAVEVPAAVLGDMGAASGAVLAALAAGFLAKKHVEHSHAIAWCAGDDGVRGAILFER